MGIITSAVCSSFKKELLQSAHSFGGTITINGGTITNGSNLITGLPSVAGVLVGTSIYGTFTGGSDGIGDLLLKHIVKIVSATSLMAEDVADRTFTFTSGIPLVIGLRLNNTYYGGIVIALIKPAPTNDYNATITNYSQLGTDEVANGSGYTTTGAVIDTTVVNNNVVFGNASWTSASFSTTGAIIHNTGNNLEGVTGRAICIINFGGTQTVTNGTFTVLLNSLSPGLLTLN